MLGLGFNRVGVSVRVRETSDSSSSVSFPTLTLGNRNKIPCMV